jgi:uncharacterized membrane protein YesL
MSGGLNFESPFMRALDIIANLLVLNILTVICSLPVFTFGAAYTALHKQLYRMRTNEEGYVVRDYFREFKSSFKQATKVWLGILAIGLVLGIDVYIFMEKGLEFAVYYKIFIYALVFTLCLCTVYVFPIIARYETTGKNAVKNALAMAFYSFFKSILMVAVTVAPWVLAMFVANFVLIDLLFGISLPAYVCVFLYNKTFQAFEEKQEEAQQEEALTNNENIEKENITK